MSIPVSQLALCVLALSALGAQRAPQIDTTTPNQDTMERIVAARETGPEHLRLMDCLGSWEVERREWRVAGQPEPAITKAIVHNTSILGGRYLRMAMTWRVGSELRESVSFVGFDKRKGNYDLITLDSATTWPTRSTGTWVQTKNNIVFDSEQNDPLTNQTTQLSTILAFTKGSWQVSVNKIVHVPGVDEPTRFKALEIVSTKKTAAVVGR
ncbi:MAG: DUF1579 family protein [Planctomycetes bacterium]|nr:DUF1579 family protein [Planctomycetota bacterium]